MNFEKDYSVIISGAGIAGVAAALAAARRGIKTALIEKTIYVGGLATTGLIYGYLPLCDGNGTQVTFGLAEELLKASLKYGPGEMPENWKRQKSAKLHNRYMARFNPSSFIFAKTGDTDGTQKVDSEGKVSNCNVWTKRAPYCRALQRTRHQSGTVL